MKKKPQGANKIPRLRATFEEVVFFYRLSPFCNILEGIALAIVKE